MSAFRHGPDWHEGYEAGFKDGNNDIEADWMIAFDEHPILDEAPVTPQAFVRWFNEWVEGVTVIRRDEHGKWPEGVMEYGTGGSGSMALPMGKWLVIPLPDPPAEKLEDPDD